MDYGCTFYTSPNKHYFSNFNELNGGRVIMRNDQWCEIKGIEPMKLKMNYGSIKIISSVRYVLRLKRNLISLGTLDKVGLNYRSENGILMVCSKDSSVKTKGTLKMACMCFKGLLYRVV